MVKGEIFVILVVLVMVLIASALVVSSIYLAPPKFKVGDCIRVPQKDIEKWEKQWNSIIVYRILEIGKKKYRVELAEAYGGRLIFTRKRDSIPIIDEKHYVLVDGGTGEKV